ncbi:MAG: MATE family efflux transporter [Spirochaetaceae bacterium]|nr:MATE family efflux transporter [Spirochaetaceae bacterium]
MDKYGLTEGGILKKLLLVALPIMGTQFVQMAYNLTDMFWLGRVGSGAVAASGAAGMYMWLSVGFLLIGRMGAEIGVSQSLGKGDKKNALLFSQNALCIAVLIGVLFGFCMILFKRELVGFFQFREAGVVRDAVRYLSIVGISVPATFIGSVIAGTFNASGNSRTPFILNSVGLVINVILDPVFILVLNWGVAGAAIATVFSQFIVCLSMISAISFFKDRPFSRYSFRIRPDKEKIIAIFKWTLPICLEGTLFCFLSMITSRFEASFGADAVAVSKVGSQIESLSWLIGGGFSSALVVFIGQNFGAAKAERIRKGVRISALIMTIWGLLVSLFLWTAGGLVFSFFLPEPRLVQMGTRYLWILAFCQLPMNLEGVGAGAFKGTGRTIQPSAASIVSNVIRPFLAYFLSRTSLGLSGIWIGIAITGCIRGIWICLWYALASRRKTG